MGLIGLESFDYCNAAQLFTGFWTTGTDVSITTSGRTRSACGGSLVKTFNQELFQITLGAAVQTGSLGPTFIFSNAISGFSFGLIPIGDGTLQVFAGLASHSNFSGPSGFVIENGPWYYFELNCSVTPIEVPPSMLHPDDTWYVACNYEVRVNENTILSGTINTPERGTPDHFWENHLHIRTIAVAAGGGVLDDLYISDGEFLGDIAVVTLMPNAVGTYNDLTPLDPGDHYLMVNEKPPDEETTYNSATTVGQKDTYRFESLVPFTGDIKGTQLMIRAVKEDAGTGSIRGVYGTGSTVTGKFFPSDFSYTYLIDPERVNPETGGDWTQSDINNVELGLIRTD